MIRRPPRSTLFPTRRSSDLPFATMVGMLESLRAWSAPYGGDLFLWVATLSLISYIALWWFKSRLSTNQLRRVIRLSALVALPLSWLEIGRAACRGRG